MINNAQTDARFIDLFSTEEFPVSNAGQFVDKIKEKPGEIVSKGGATFRIIALPPGAKLPMH